MHNNWYRRLLLLFSIVGIFFVLQWHPLWNIIQSYLQRITLPITHVAYRSIQWFEPLWRARTLENENKQLRQQLAYEQVLQTELNQIKLENTRLRSLAKILPPRGFTSVGVEVIGKQIINHNTIYLINRGSRDGVRKGMPLVVGISKEGLTGSGVLIGTIYETSNSVSSFQPITSSTSKVLVELLNTEKNQGVAEGEYELAIRVKYLSIDSKISNGNQIITSNLDPLVPPGLLIGYVTGVERIAGDFFQSALVTPAVPLDRFQFLYLMQQTP